MMTTAAPPPPPHTSTHTYFYKILPTAPPSPLPPTLPLSPLDSKDNFIHLSTATQTPLTANSFFSGHRKLWLLKLRVEDLDGRVEFLEGMEGCPHLHGSEGGLGRGNVVEVIVVEKREEEGDGEGDWRDVEALKGLED